MAMLPPLASIEELEARLGITLTGVDLSRAEAMLDDASALIRSIAEQDWVDSGSGDELDWGDLAERDIDAIQAIALAVAYRGYRNPDGATQSSVGDVSVSFGRTPGGSVYLTSAESALIRRATGASSVTSVGLVSPWVGASSNYYVPVEGGGDYFPIGPFPWEVI